MNKKLIIIVVVALLPSRTYCQPDHNVSATAIHNATTAGVRVSSSTGITATNKAMPCTSVLYLADVRAGMAMPLRAKCARIAVIASSRAVTSATGNHQ